MRNYGYWVENKKEPGADGVQIDKVLDPVLAKVTNMKYRSFDLDYPDVKRAQTFLDDLAQFESAEPDAALMIMRLGQRSYVGTTPGKIAPLSAFADNDYALGMIVEGVSRSKFWGSTAIFVIEDDAQNGPDHVDSHRSPAFVISPYTRRGMIDSTMYNTTSMLRTMELILHLRPMTHFDAGARPMFASFAQQPSLAPYQAEKPRISLEERNPANSSTAARSARLDFSKEDLNDDDELNDILWRAHSRHRSAAARPQHVRPITEDSLPRAHLCFVWHMHQPFYKDLVTGEYRLPWTRFHALKDYYGMVKMLQDFPSVHQTFNLVPSMMVQIEEYAAGAAADPFLDCAVKPAEELSEAEREFVLRYFFQANADHLIYRYPRYGELFNVWKSCGANPQVARRHFSVQDLRDLQVLSQLAWFDEEFQEHDEEVKALVAKGRDYSLDDQALMARKEREILAAVVPVYKEFAARGQIEISTTPFYHPILPLICDSDIASVSHPGVTLPAVFDIRKTRCIN